MRPETGGPWRKTLRAEAKGESRGKHVKTPDPSLIRRGSTWLRRHWWMPQEERQELYRARSAPSTRSNPETAVEANR